MRTEGVLQFLRGCGLLAAVWLSAGATPGFAQQAPVTVQVEIVKRGAEQLPAAAAKSTDHSNVVVWLSPLDRWSEPTEANSSARPVRQLVQRDKTFEPHVLVIQAGSEVQFPNKDLIFHDVFSLFHGKRFDLGLYEAGSSKSVHFDRVGVSYLFCNIHEEMTAVVVAVDTPYFGLSDRSGHVVIPNVRDGRYQMHVWYERGLPEEMKNLDRVVEVSGTARTLGSIRVVQNPAFTPAHKNAYGQDYVPPSSSGYSAP
jgi:plastocyanin